jgi:hypothetical protein
MEQICKEHLSDIDGDVVLQLIEFSVDEMTQTADYLPDQQLHASGILVALGQGHCNEVCVFYFHHVIHHSVRSSLKFGFCLP